MSIKVHFLFSRFDRFPDNLRGVCDEQGERFHQDIKVMKEHYLGRWDVNMMAGLLRETVQMLNTQGSQGRENFFLS